MTGLEFLNKEARKLAKKCAEARRETVSSFV